MLAKNVEAVDRRRGDATATCDCAACGAPDATMVCERCRRAWYCSAACQRAHWRGAHKAACAAAVAARVEVVLRRPARGAGERVALEDAAGAAAEGARPRECVLWDDDALERLMNTVEVVKATLRAGDGASVAVINETREFFALVAADELPAAHAALAPRVRSAPRGGGAEAFFSALYRRGDDGRVEVAIDAAPLELQSWDVRGERARA